MTFDATLFDAEDVFSLCEDDCWITLLDLSLEEVETVKQIADRSGVNMTLSPNCPEVE